MIKHKLFSIVLVIITVLIINFTFALVAKDAFAPAMDPEVTMMENTAHNNSAHMNYHSDNDALACEVHCDALLMSCSLGISNFTQTDMNTDYTLVQKLNIPSDDALYSIDLVQDHKPPIFS